MVPGSHPTDGTSRLRRAWAPALLAVPLALLAAACGGGGGGSASRPAPRIQSFSPDAGHAGTTLVTLRGTGFTGFTAVTFGAVAAPSAQGGDDTTITVQVPVGAVTGPITVTTPGGSHASAGTFTVHPAPDPAPAVAGFEPASGFPGQSVILSGTGFTGATQVAFGGAAAAEYWVDGDTRIRAVVPPAAVTGPLTVWTPGGSGASLASFTILPTPVPPRAAPTVTAFTPLQGPPGTRVAVTGTHLATVTQVDFSGVPGELEVLDDQNLVATVPPGAGTGPITVVAPAGAGTSAEPFTVTAPPALGVTGLSASTGAPGTTITLTGAGFAGATGVTFGGVAALVFEVVDDTTVTAQVPAGAASGPVAVAGPQGRFESPAAFTVTGGPAVPSLPMTLTGCVPFRATRGTLLLITGTGLRKVTAVYFGEVRASDVRVNNDGSMRVRVPLMATSGLIFADSPDGSSSWGPFTVEASPAGPVITGFSPPSGSPGMSVTLTGSGFTGDSEVIFGEYGTRDLTVSPDGTRITVVVPARAVTGRLGVSTVDGFQVSADPFTVVPPAPPLATGFAPDSGRIGDRVTVTGANLDQVREVLFTPAQAGTQVAGQVVAARPDGTAVTVEVPAGAATGPLALDYNGPQVAVPGGDFTLLAAGPAITGFSPAAGIPGTEVTLSGRGLLQPTVVSFNGAALAPGRVTLVSDRELRVRIPDNSRAGTQGRFAVATGAGAVASDGAFRVLDSRASVLDRPLARTAYGPAGVTLLDLPALNRAAPYAMQIPRAPVFHPKVLQNAPRSRPDGPNPSFIMNLQLPPWFYPALPKALRNEVANLRLDPAEVDITVVAQHNVWIPGQPARIVPDNYEFQPQYWAYPDAPFAGDRALTSLMRVCLFPDRAGTLGWRSYGPGLLDDMQFGFQPLQFNGPLEVAGQRLVLDGIQYDQSYAFFTLVVLNDRAAVTLHLLLNDLDQGLLALAAADASLTSTAKVFENLAELGFSQTAGLAWMARPLITRATRRPLPGQGMDEILLYGDLFQDDPDNPSPLVVRVSSPAGPVQQDADRVEVLGATLVRLVVPAGTAVRSVSVATRLGESDVFEIE